MQPVGYIGNLTIRQLSENQVKEARQTKKLNSIHRICVEGSPFNELSLAFSSISNKRPKFLFGRVFPRNAYIEVRIIDEQGKASTRFLILNINSLCDHLKLDRHEIIAEMKEKKGNITEYFLQKISDDLDSNDKTEAALAKALVLLRKGDINLAKRSLKEIANSAESTSKQKLEAHYFLGKIYQKTGQKGKAERYFLMAKAHPKALFEFLMLTDSNHFEEFLNVVKKISKSDSSIKTDPEINLMLAHCYEKGLGVKPNKKIADKYLKNAVKVEDPFDCKNVLEFLKTRSATLKNQNIIFNLYVRIYEHKSTPPLLRLEAENNLIECFSKGIGVAIDQEKAKQIAKTKTFSDLYQEFKKLPKRAELSEEKQKYFDALSSLIEQRLAYIDEDLSLLSDFISKV